MPSPEVSAAARYRTDTLLRERVGNPVTLSRKEVRGLVFSLEADRIELEEELRRLVECRSQIEQTSNRYADLYAFAPLSYVLLSGDGLIEDLNCTFADLVGVGRESLQGKPLVDLVAIDDRETFRTHLLACRRDKAKVSVELDLQVGTKRCVPVQLHTVLDHVPPGTDKPDGFRMALVDMTELIRDRQEKERAQRHLQHLQKLQSLVTMAGGVAHDLNNVLTVIQGFAGLVQSELFAGGHAYEQCNEILKACKRAAELGGQMLAFTGQWDRTIQRHDPADVVRGMQTSIGNVVLGRAPVEYALSTDIPPIDIDLSRIRQAILDLVTNAVEALDPNREGRIRIAATRTRVDLKQAQTMAWGDQLQGGHYAVFEVSDNGRGMDDVIRGKMFDPFFSTKFTGRGLGLCSVLGIIRAHNGGLDVRSTPPCGTAVKIYLPLATRHTPLSTGGPVTDDDDGQHAKNVVLVVDDEAQILHIVERGLSKRGFTVLKAHDGVDAVEVFRENKDVIDAVLLDMTMPRMDGREAFCRMRAIKADVPVIVMSGYTEVEAMRQFDERGIAGFIPKPFTANGVVLKLRAVIRSRRAR